MPVALSLRTIDLSAAARPNRESTARRWRNAVRAPHRAPARPPAEGLRLLRPPLHLAQEVGARLAEREVLLGCVPAEGEPHVVAHGAVSVFGRIGPRG